MCGVSRDSRRSLHSDSVRLDSNPKRPLYEREYLTLEDGALARARPELRKGVPSHIYIIYFEIGLRATTVRSMCFRVAPSSDLF